MKTDTERRLEVNVRRERLRELNLCINGPMEFGRPGKRGVIHGPVVRGNKCQHCIDTHRGTDTSAKRAERLRY